MQQFEDYWLDAKQIWDMPPKEPNAVGMVSTNLAPFYYEDDVTEIKSGTRCIYIVIALPLQISTTSTPKRCASTPGRHKGQPLD
jgi:hypothetical protein